MNDQCASTIKKLIKIIHELQDVYESQSELDDRFQILENLDEQRQNLTADLYTLLPSPVPEVLADDLLGLQDAINALKKSLIRIQQESSEKVFQMKSYKKAKKAYSQF